MIGRKGKLKQRKIFSLTCILILIVSTLLVAISLPIPTSSGATVDHNVGNLDIRMLSDFGRFLLPLTWGTYQTTNDPSSGFGFIGLVIDQDNYDHTPDTEDIADSFGSWPYVNQDDLTKVNDATMIIDDGTTQKSIASFQNTGAGTNDPNDILINQTAWTVVNKDWAIIQWTLSNQKGIPITGVCMGLELPLSQVGAGFGVGGDSGDDIDGFDSTNGTYWAQDDGGTTIGFGSAIASDPITHYYSEDYHPATYDDYKVYWENETWLYNRIHAPNATVGTTPGNRTTTIGWNGETIDISSSKTFTLTIAMGNDYADMISALSDAQNYYKTEVTGVRITEFSDSSSATPQIELFNFGAKDVDQVAEGYFLSLDGITPMSGTWDKNPIPGYDYGVFTLSGGTIGPEGDTIGLYQDLGGGNIILMDEVSYGLEGTTPDPISGESVVRRYDAVTARYTNEWLRNTSSGPTWGTQNDVLAIDLTPDVILNQVMFNPGTPELGFIELMYLGGSSLDIQDYKIVCDSEYAIPISLTLTPSNRYFVFTQSDDPTFFSQMSSSGDNVYLYDNSGRLLDMVGWNSPHFQSMSVCRVPDGSGTYQGFNDTTSEAAGWTFNNPLEVLITEFSDNESAAAQIEIYNPWYPQIDFSSGFSFESDSGPLSGIWTIPTANADSYALFNVTTSFGLNSEGDTISIFQNGVLIEKISYGQKGTVPDPLPNESVQRILDMGNYTNSWSRNITSGPTFGSQNNVPLTHFSSEVVLNEVVFNPGAPEYAFIELMYVGGGTLDIQDYSIICDNEFRISQSLILTSSNPYFVLSQPDDPNLFNQMNPSGDNIYLYDDSGRLLDMVGWSSSHTVNKSAARVPEGSGGRLGHNDPTSSLEGWVFDSNPTLPLVSIEPGQFQIGIQGMTLSYILNVSNNHNFDDVIDISYSSVSGWAVELLQFDGVTPLNDTETGAAMDGVPDTGIIPPYSMVQIVVNITIPFGIPSGISEFTNIFANSSFNPMATDSVLLNSSTLMGMEYRRPNRYVTFVRGTLMVIGQVDNTQVKVTDISNGNQLFQFSVNEGESWTTTLTDVHVDINATNNATVLSGNALNTSGGNSWMSYLPTNQGQKYGTLLYGFAPAEMFIFVPRINPLPPTSVTITDISDGDDSQTLTSSSADFSNSDVEIYKVTGFDDDIVKIESNIQISVLAGKVPGGVDWTVTPPSINGTEKGKRFFVFASESLTILPLEDNTTVDVIDLSDGDDSRSQLMNRFDILTQRSVSEFLNPIVTRPGVTLYHNSNNLIDDDYLEIIADKDILVYIGPISDQRQEFADLSPSVSTGIFSQEVFTYAQNGGANDLQVFVYDKNNTVVKITSLTYSWAPGSGRDTFFDFTIDADDLSGAGPWWWEWGGWGGNVLHIQSNLPISVFNGDFDGASFGSFLSVINPPENLKYPDVVITSSDISFSPGSVVQEGSTVELFARIHNLGEVNVTDIKVSFYNGHPALGGTMIGVNQTIPYLDVGDNLTLNMSWQPPLSGLYMIYIALDYPSPGLIIELDETNNLASKVLEVFRNSPPELHIDSQVDDIILNWTMSETAGVSNYLIYRSASQIDFDFSTPWKDTSDTLANGTDPVDGLIIPLRSTWNDTQAASNSAPMEYYYILRAVFKSNEISGTSRTVGKWTRLFPSGKSSFSLPLEPLQILRVDELTIDMGATYIKYINSTSHKWVPHYFGDGNTNNSRLEMGRGCEINFNSPEKYTFVGMPAAMIKYDSNGFEGFDYNSDARNLLATVDSITRDVALTWSQPASSGLIQYKVYYSTTRDGFYGVEGVDYFLLTTTPIGNELAVHPGVALPGTQYYYMVIPFNDTDFKGASTYSIGVWTASYFSGYDTFALPLKLKENDSADWYCDNIEYTKGINYFNSSWQKWRWHSTVMPQGAFDPIIEIGLGYQISTTTATKFTFIGI